MIHSYNHRVGRIVSSALLLSTLNLLDAARWRDITPEEFAQKEPIVDPESGAEILFSEATLEQEFLEGLTIGSFQFYNRIKVFNEQGVEEMSKFELTYNKGQEIRRVEGRTIKPDGTVIELDKDSIFDQDVVKKGRSNVRATSFAFPNLEPGDIIELRYSRRTGREAFVVGMEFLNELPAQRVYRSIKPFSAEGIGNKIMKFQLPNVKLERNRRGAYEFELSNLPAKPDEPFSFPDMHLGPFVILYYFVDEPSLKTYWKARSKELFSDGKRKLKPSKQIQQFVEEHTAKASTVDDKLRMLYRWCQSELTNHRYSYGVYTAKEREALPENFSPQHTFSRKHGTPDDINELFGAMARSLGLQAQLTSTNDIRNMIFNENVKAYFALNDNCVAVDIDGDWRFFNPGGSPFLAFDSLPWWACGSQALIGDSKDKKLVPVPMPTADYSIQKRTGNFSIDDQGNLTGTVTLELSGFHDLDMKEELSTRHTEEEEYDYIIQELKKNLSQTEAKNFKIRNRSSRKTISISYDLEIPEYADVTRKRIFLQPAVFQKNADPIFSRDKRQGDLLFPYPWTDVDDISIKVPEQFALEEGSAPQPIDLGVIGQYEAKLGITKKNVLKYRRTFGFNLRMVAKKHYESIKKVFNVVNQLDQHTLTFKRIESAEN